MDQSALIAELQTREAAGQRVHAPDVRLRTHGSRHTCREARTRAGGAIGGDGAPADDGAVTHAEVIMSAVRTRHRGVKALGGKRGSARIAPLHGHMFTGKTHAQMHTRKRNPDCAAFRFYCRRSERPSGTPPPLFQLLLIGVCTVQSPRTSSVPVAAGRFKAPRREMRVAGAGSHRRLAPFWDAKLEVGFDRRAATVPSFKSSGETQWQW